MSQLKIYARVRLNTLEGYKNRPFKITLHEQNIQIIQEKLNVVNKRIMYTKDYHFDKIYDIDYDNIDIYNELGRKLLNHISQNQNSVFYVYGQTGSGKTHSLLGNHNTPGMIQYLLEDLTHVFPEIKYCGIQVYNNRCYDIFNNNNMIRECEVKDGSIQFTNITRHTLTRGLIKDTISKIKTARHVGISSSNDVSSRSHLIIKLYVNNRYIMLVDLAGSERAKRSQYNGQQNMRENADINLGILALKECIRGIKRGNIPYRNSKITKILKETFSSSVHSYILATMSPLKKDIQDSMDTLKYMSDFKKFKKKDQSVLPPIPDVQKESLNKINLGINLELNKAELEHTKLLGLIEDNIKSLNDLKCDLLHQRETKKEKADKLRNKK